VKCPPFEYHRATDVADAVAALAAADGEGKILAGGQSLVPVLALRMARPDVLVDVNRVPGLADLALRDGVLHAGALVRHTAAASPTPTPPPNCPPSCGRATAPCTSPDRAGRAASGPTPCSSAPCRAPWRRTR
jgi:hypothetical protein